MGRAVPPTAPQVLPSPRRTVDELMDAVPRRVLLDSGKRLSSAVTDPLLGITIVIGAVAVLLIILDHRRARRIPLACDRPPPPALELSGGPSVTAAGPAAQN
jgi:hypothetical protein